MKIQTQLKVFVLLTTVSTLALALLFLAINLLPWDVAPEWLFNPTLLTILGTIWFYSTLNTFNYIWLEKRDILLELIQGFSALSVIWTISTSFGAFQNTTTEWILQLAQFIIILTVYLSILRTLLHARSNTWSNICRWIAIASTSIFTGIQLVNLFVTISPANVLFDSIWNTVAVISLTSLFLTPVLFYLPGKKS